MSEPLLEVRGLDVGYGQTQVLREVIVIAAGARVGLFGPSGHGKTTLLRTISGLLHPSAGQIRFAGGEIGGLQPSKSSNSA